MDILQSIILGIVQGLTEFLPISSSGHLLFFQKLMNVNENSVIVFDVMVHLGTLLAIIAFFWRDILELIRKPFSKMTLLLVVGCIPTAIIGFLFEDLFEELGKTGRSMGFEFILTGLILWFVEYIRQGNKTEKEMTWLDSIIMGIMQGVAILPAISRSGLTIASGLFRGLNREFAGKFSFLLSAPIIFGLGMLHVIDYVKEYDTMRTALGPVEMGVGFVAAAISGYLAIKFMLKLLMRKGSMKIFSIYVFALGAFILLDQFVLKAVIFK